MNNGSLKILKQVRILSRTNYLPQWKVCELFDNYSNFWRFSMTDGQTCNTTIKTTGTVQQNMQYGASAKFGKILVFENHKFRKILKRCSQKRKAKDIHSTPRFTLEN